MLHHNWTDSDFRKILNDLQHGETTGKLSQEFACPYGELINAIVHAMIVLHPVTNSKDAKTICRSYNIPARAEYLVVYEALDIFHYSRNIQAITFIAGSEHNFIKFQCARKMLNPDDFMDKMTKKCKCDAFAIRSAMIAMAEMEFYNNPNRYSQSNNNWLVDKWNLGGDDTAKLMSRISPVRSESRLRILKSYPGFGCAYLCLTYDQAMELKTANRRRKTGSKFSDTPNLPAAKRAVPESIEFGNRTSSIDIAAMQQKYTALEEKMQIMSEQLAKNTARTNLALDDSTDNLDDIRDIKNQIAAMSKRIETISKSIEDMRSCLDRENASKTACERDVQEQLDAINGSMVSIVSDHRGLISFLQNHVEKP